MSLALEEFSTKMLDMAKKAYLDGLSDMREMAAKMAEAHVNVPGSKAIANDIRDLVVSAEEEKE